MFTYYAHTPTQIARVEMGRHGELMFTPSRRPVRRGNPVGLPDREINRRLAAELGYAPRPGEPLKIPAGISVNLDRGQVVAWPELMGFARRWPSTEAPVVVGLLGQNTKLVKGSRKYVVMGLSLTPADTSGHQVCVFSTPECRELCLAGSGKGAATTDAARIRRFKQLHPGLLRWGGGPEIARILRTLWLFENPLTFLLQLASDIDWFVAAARSHRVTPVLRMNVLSDIRWENIPFPNLRTGRWSRNVMEAYPAVQFYDYTKDPGRDLENLPPNYDITFSLAETTANQRHAANMLARGVNVAVVFDVQAHPPKPLPREFWGVRVVDGDESDLRFLDPRPAVVGLRFKQMAGKAAAGVGSREQYDFIQATMDCGNGLVVAKDGRHFTASGNMGRR